MARITVEDCLENVDNRFELVMVSSKRARQLQIEGKDPLVPVDNDKPTVLALREIAEGLVDAKILTARPSVEIEDPEAAMQEAAEAVEAAGVEAAEKAVAAAADAETADEQPESDAEQEAPTEEEE